MTNKSGAIVAGPAYQSPNRRSSAMAEKIIKAKIIYKCRFNGQHKVPGDIIEGPETEIKYLCQIKRATEDLKWEPPVKKEEKKKEEKR
jgi:hypothetical protein